MRTHPFITAALLACWMWAPTATAEEATGATGEAAPKEATSWREKLDIRFYENASSGTLIKPIIRLAGGVNHQFRSNDGQPGQAQDYEDRITTTAILQFGMYGQVVEGLTFYSEFERNLGSYGTSVWSGSASLQARLNYLRYEFKGFSLSAGVILDPGSVDFVSDHILDHLGRDDTVAFVPFFSGIHMSQGVMARYKLLDNLDFGVTFSSGNPMATGLSYGFGGKVAAIGNIWFLSAKTWDKGEPGSDAQLLTISPSLVWRQDLGFVDLELRATVQIYHVNIDTNNGKDETLGGQNYKGSLKLTWLDGTIATFVNGNYRTNEMLVQADPMDISQLSDQGFVGYTVSGGIDYNYAGKNGIGINYGMIQEEPGENTPKTQQYINIGTTYWVIEDHMALGLRYAKYIHLTDGRQGDGQVDFDSYFVSMRLLLD